MQLKKLDNSFYANNSHLIEALDNHNGNWVKGKVRGYGIVIITVKNLTFAIPLRSNIKHKAAYITTRSKKKGFKGKGLDFSKALLIPDQSYISKLPFKIPPEEYKALDNKEHYITKKFDKYVSKYTLSVKNSDQNILMSAEYRYSTLINYHTELELG